MVELENDNVCYAAVNAGVVPQELDDESTVYRPLMLRSRIQRRAKRRTIVAIVFRIRVVLAGSAIRLKAIGATNPPCESFEGLEFTATSTPFHVRSIANVCASMVASCAHIARASNGAPGGSRTPIVPLRRRMPYPLDHGRTRRSVAIGVFATLGEHTRDDRI